MFSPIVIAADGSFRRTSKPIRVGEAVQPHHAVTLGQVRELLRNLDMSGVPFTGDSLGRLTDTLTGFLVPDTGGCVGRINETFLPQDAAVDPPVLVIAGSVIGLADRSAFLFMPDTGKGVGRINEFASFLETFYQPPAPVIIVDPVGVIGDMIGLMFSGAFGLPQPEGVFAGFIREEVTVVNTGIISTPPEAVVEPAGFSGVSGGHVLSETVHDPQGGWIQAVTGQESMTVSEAFHTYPVFSVTDTITATINVPAAPKKPKSTGEARTMTDGAYGFIELKEASSP